MNKSSKVIATSALGAALILGTAGFSMAGTQADDGESDGPITGAALDQASAAAISVAGGGHVTETSLNDEEGKYDVEVTLDNGDRVDVLLDANFAVVSHETESGD
jgi:uncharacterized membrane protein YkoI